MKVVRKIIRILYKTAAYILGILLVSAIAFHLWFINHSEKAIEQLISMQSNGKLQCKIKKLRINYFNNRIDIKEINLYNTDTTSAASLYNISVEKFSVNIKSKWALLFHKKLIIDSLVFDKPNIIITKTGVQLQSKKKKLPLVDELGNFYKDINNTLGLLDLDLFKINDGHITINDLTASAKNPFNLSHIFFSINKFKVDSSNSLNSSKFIFSERIFLRLGEQSIVLPDNKSTITFKNLEIDTKNKFIRIEKPLIDIVLKQSSKSNLNIHMDRMGIADLDFNSLYFKQRIEADSLFFFNIYSTANFFGGAQSSIQKKEQNTSKVPLDTLLHRLPLAINVQHIVIQNGNLDIGIHNTEKVTHFSTTNDNVAIKGFHINDSAEQKGFKIDSFKYTIRNATNYLPDSLVRFSFDSLTFLNDKIILYQFKAKTAKLGKDKMNRDYTIPRFEITGLDWFSFIFQNHFSAEEATLYNPTLKLEKLSAAQKRNNPGTSKKKSIYDNLSVMDKLIDLEKLNINNGHLTFKQKDNLNVDLQSLNLSVDIGKLGSAKTPEQLFRSVQKLNFSSAIVNNNLATVNIDHLFHSQSEKKLFLQKVLINSKDGNSHAELDGVVVKHLSLEENILNISGIYWGAGNITVIAKNLPNNQKSPGHTPTGDALQIFIDDIQGKNTNLHFENRTAMAKAYFSNISINSLVKESNKPLSIEDFNLAGRNIDLKLADNRVTATDFFLEDEAKSFLNNITYTKNNMEDSISVNVHKFSFVPYVRKSLESGKIIANSIVVDQPKIQLALGQVKKNKQAAASRLPILDINVFSILNAQLHVKNKDVAIETDDLSIGIQALKTQNDSGLYLSGLKVNTNNLAATMKNGDKVNVFGGPNISLDNYTIWPTTHNWQMQLQQLNARKIAVEKNAHEGKQSIMLVNDFSLNNIYANKDVFENKRSWFLNSSGAILKVGHLQKKSDNSEMQLSGLTYKQKTHNASIDSFSVSPGKTIADFFNQIEFRKDYLFAASGKMEINGIGIKDSVLSISSLVSKNGNLSIFSNKLVKKDTVIDVSVKPLPVTALKRIKLPLKIDTVLLNNASVKYTELSLETKDTGRVYFNNVDAKVYNVLSSPNLGPDSLRVNIHANFIDSFQFHLALSESYRDSLAGMKMHIGLGEGNLQLLNPFLHPLVSISAKSGYLNSLSLDVVANDYVSQGIVRLYYQHASAQLLDSGRTDRRRFKTRLLTFLANTFFIKKKNYDRTETYYFARNRQKSTIDYFLKLVTRGAASTVVPLVRKKYKKQYIKAIKAKDIPVSTY